jgi:hypothetical protein
MGRAAINIFHRIGRRGIFLLFLALLDLIVAYSYFYPTLRAIQNPTNVFLAHIAPLSYWGLLWATVGSVCLVCAFAPKDALGYAAAMFLKLLWGTTFLLGWIFTDVERGYLTATIWLAFAGVTGLIATWPDDWKR